MAVEPVEREPGSVMDGAPAPEMDIGRRTLLGTIDAELYERLIKPAFFSFAWRRDDEPLRQIVESLTSSIAMNDAYKGFQKIDDICQRYLYYLESCREARRRTRELVELTTLCEFWRRQVFMVCIRDARAVFDVLLPRQNVEASPPVRFEQGSFLRGIEAILNASLGAPGHATRDTASCRDLFDFFHGTSFPWLGYDPDALFGPLADDETITHGFALANADQTARFAQDCTDVLQEALFIDLLYAQHRKLYDEIAQAFESSERLPYGFRVQLAQRVRFDKTYQTAYDALLQGNSLDKPLHRSSRLQVEDLNAFGAACAVLRKAAASSQGVFLFHFMG